MGIHIDGWVQNKFLSDSLTVENLEKKRSVAISNEKIWGGALSLTGSVRLFSWPVKLFGELGGKTQGYLPGYSLSGGLVVRGGLIVCEK